MGGRACYGLEIFLGKGQGVVKNELPALAGISLKILFPHATQ